MNEQNQLETQLVEVNRQLIVTSRRASQAEIATSVLHNIGNVLNSINISSEMVRQKLQQSGTADLLLLADALQQHHDDVATYLTQDERGKHLVPFLIDLIHQVTANERSLLQEFQSLIKNIDHIRDIVTLQQSHASAGGLVREVSLTDLIEDALRINLASIKRHGIEIIRHFEEVPDVVLDSQRLLQALVNLISNAKYALIDSDSELKRLAIHLRQAGKDRVQIAVEDNGVGIDPEHLVQVCDYGFTTRPDGHGFGLYSASSSIKELGGTLRVHSDGPGTGATFTIDIPIHQTGEVPCAMEVTC